MIFSLDVRRARKGDCLLLHFGSKDAPGLALVDGGPRSVYKPHLKPRLLEIRKARKLADKDALPVDLLMVSHVDDDHIQGILELTSELIAVKEKQGAPPLRVLGFWHNSFDDIIGNRPDELTSAVTSAFGAASLGGELPADATLERSDLAEEVVVDSLKVLASIEQGHRLRKDAELLDFPLNPDFDGKLILASNQSLEVAEDLTFVVAGPMKPEVERLQQKHDQWLKEQKKKKRPGESALAAYVDDSIPNLSSIVVLAKRADRQMLLTGDARGDKILEGLEKVGLLAAGGTMHIDVLKVPHHGSSNNVEDDFFERITADHYVFSGNGEHGNPERESLDMLLRARGSAPFTLHFTYSIAEIDAGREADWNKERARETKRQQQGKTTKKPRKAWSPDEQSLAAFFAKARMGAKQAITIAEDGKSHVIDLLDPLGY